MATETSALATGLFASSTTTPASTAGGVAAVDRALALLRSPAGGSLPKGMTKETLAIVVGALREMGEASAGQIGDFLGVSRITARRYLEHLADTGAAERTLRYGQVGRPETQYGLRRQG